MPKVSVIIPNYNHAPYLEKRIQSILEQTYQDFEILFLDDASSDNSREIFAQFADHPKIRAIFNDENTKSPFKQWNKGIKNTTGEYIWLAESDDYADPNFLETLVPLLDKHPSVGLAYCQSWEVDPQGSIIGNKSDGTDDICKKRWRSNYINNGLDECKNYLVIKNTIPNASAVLIRRKSFEQIGQAEESMFLCGDWMTWVKLLMVSDVAFVGESLNYFRQHNSSVRVKSRLQALDIIETIEVVSFVKEHISLPHQVISRVQKQLVNEWIHRLVFRTDTIRSERCIQLYGSFKNFNSSVESDIASSLGLNLYYLLKSKVRKLIFST
jgi:glycosyltransferase involved in cell wall biosynthesis